MQLCLQFFNKTIILSNPVAFQQDCAYDLLVRQNAKTRQN
jgi:hypothetical protein